MSELVESLGYYDNQLVDYTSFLSSYSERKIGGVVDRILNSTGRRWACGCVIRTCVCVSVCIIFNNFEVCFLWQLYNI